MWLVRGISLSYIILSTLAYHWDYLRLLSHRLFLASWTLNFYLSICHSHNRLQNFIAGLNKHGNEYCGSSHNYKEEQLRKTSTFLLSCVAKRFSLFFIGIHKTLCLVRQSQGFVFVCITMQWFRIIKIKQKRRQKEKRWYVLPGFFSKCSCCRWQRWRHPNYRNKRAQQQSKLK